MALIAGTVSCSPDWKDDMVPGIPVTGQHGKPIEDREVNTDTRKVLLLYSAGFNSLSSYLKEDIEELCTGWVPRKRRAEDVILVYSHLPESRGQYSKKTSPVLFRLYAEHDGTVVRDTLAVYDPETISASAGQLHDVLSYIKDKAAS